MLRALGLLDLDAISLRLSGSLGDPPLLLQVPASRNASFMFAPFPLCSHHFHVR